VPNLVIAPVGANGKVALYNGSAGTIQLIGDVSGWFRGVVAPVTKVLVFVEENHSLNEMKVQMPYALSLAQRYEYASNYQATTHPSLPNYLAIAGGSTFGVIDDAGPLSHQINASSVFGRAIAAGRTAKTYAEGMGSNCSPTNVGGYAVKHNPWVYFTPGTSEHEKCLAYDVPETALANDIKNGTLPTVGVVVPDLCHDGHDCSLATADAWFKSRMANVLAGPDFKAGRLAVILTADEDDSTQTNTILTMVVHPSLDGLHTVINTPLTHYSLTRLLQDVSHSTPYLLSAADAPNLATAFGLKLG
jgi:acid phosphatase